METATNAKDRYLDLLTQLVLEKLENPSKAAEGEWFKVSRFHSQNALGSTYSGINIINLDMITALRGYTIPVWLTGNQARQLGIHILKGEASSTIWTGATYYDKATGKKLDKMRYADYEALSPIEKDKIRVVTSPSFGIPVFNLAQTNFKEVYPAEWEALEDAFNIANYDEGQRYEDIESVCENFRSGWYPDDSRKVEVIYTADIIKPEYRREVNQIVMRDPQLYDSRHDYYLNVVQAIASSAATERLQARMAKLKEVDMVQEICVSELAAELVRCFMLSHLGLETRPSQSAIKSMGEWASVLKKDRTLIHQSMSQASRILNIVQKQLMYLGMTEVPDVCATVKNMLTEAQEKAKSERKNPDDDKKYKFKRSTGKYSNNPSLFNNRK